MRKYHLPVVAIVCKLKLDLNNFGRELVDEVGKTLLNQCKVCTLKDICGRILNHLPRMSTALVIDDEAVNYIAVGHKIGEVVEMLHFSGDKRMERVAYLHLFNWTAGLTHLLHSSFPSAGCEKINDF